MDYEEFQRQLGKAGLSIRAFASLIKMRHNSVTNYSKTGEVPSHLAVISALLGEMGERHIDFREVISRIDIKPKKARGGGKGKFGGDKATNLDLWGDNNV